MKLTIAIPTFNRNEILCKNISKLLPQITVDCRLIIVDNASDVPVQDTLSGILNEHPDVDVRIIRNRVNLGMTANILRCFEECRDPWLWVLGDDDEVHEDAIETLLGDIDKNPDSHFVTYAWDEDTLRREKEVVTSGLDSFLDTFETFGAVLFLSTSVYNMDKVIGSISFAQFFQSSYAPHLVMLFMSLGDEGKCKFSPKQIVSNMAEETPAELKWDQMFIYQLTLLLRLPLPPKTIFKLKQRLRQLTRVWTLYHFIFTLVFKSYERGVDNKPVVLYGEVVRGFFHLDARLTSRIVAFLGFFIVRYPFVFRWIFSRIFKVLKGRDFMPDDNLRI